MGPTVGEALIEFRKANGLTAVQALESWWTCRLGPFLIRLPNFQWRQQAILAHDLHHVLTGYPCGLRGEFQVAAWEFGAGPMPHWGATLFCFPLVIAGLFLTPRRVLRAFRAGRQSRSLHNSQAIDVVLATPLDVARTGVQLAESAGISAANRERQARRHDRRDEENRDGPWSDDR